MKINHLIEFASEPFDTETGKLFCGGNHNAETKLFLMWDKRSPLAEFAAIKLYSKDLPVHAREVNKYAKMLGKEICQRWNSYKANQEVSFELLDDGLAQFIIDARISPRVIRTIIESTNRFDFIEEKDDYFLFNDVHWQAEPYKIYKFWTLNALMLWITNFYASDYYERGKKAMHGKSKEGSFKTLVYQGKYVNFDELCNGIYISDIPCLFKSDSSIASILNNYCDALANMGIHDDPIDFISNLNKCELITISIKPE